MTEQHKNLVYIPVQLLKVEMYVSALDRPWLGTPFPIQGFKITSPDDIDLVSSICKHVYIDAEKSEFGLLLPDRHIFGKNSISKNQLNKPLKYSYRPPVAKYHGNQVYMNKYSFDEELKNVGNIYQLTQNTMNQISEDLKLGRNIDIDEMKKVSKICVESIFNNKDSLLWFSLIKNCDRYTSDHSLNVAILSTAFARHLGFSKKVLNIIALCGLLHDVGKVNIPLNILNKEGKLTEDEFAIMKQHPTLGRDILLKQTNIPPEVIDATYSHHERIDGSGYPEGKKGLEIPFYAQLVAIIDSYDAITSDRCYQNSRTTLKALAMLYKSTENLYDEKLIKNFIQWLGIYPLGSIVEMNNGEVGIVLSGDPEWKTKPRVALLLDEEKNNRPQRIVDLTKGDVDRQGKEYWIKFSHPNNTFGINLSEFQQKFMQQSPLNA